MLCRLDLTPLNTSDGSGKVQNRKVLEDVLTVMRIRTFQIIVLQVLTSSSNAPASWSTLGPSEWQLCRLSQVLKCNAGKQSNSQPIAWLACYALDLFPSSACCYCLVQELPDHEMSLQGQTEL